MKRYNFDYVEEEGQDALQEVKDAATACGGHITLYVRIGPGGGNSAFELEVSDFAKFEAWLLEKGFEDPEEYGVEEEVGS